MKNHPETNIKGFFFENVEINKKNQRNQSM